MMNSEMERYSIILIKTVIVLILTITVFFAVNYFIPMVFNVSETLAWGFLPFILAVVLAILIDPFVDWFVCRKNIKRGIAVAFTLSLLLIFITIVIIFIISRLVIELTGLYSSLPDYTQFLMKFGLETVEQIRNYISNNPLPQEAQDALRSNLQVLAKGMTDLIGSSTNFLINLLTGLPGFVTIIIVSALATFFISRDKAIIMNFIYRLTPKKYVKPISMVIGEISTALVGFFRAQTILISITGFLTVIGLTILKAKYALTIGILVGFFDLLPVLGPGTILAPWAIIQFILGNVSFGISILILYGVLVGIRQLIEPKILSQNIGLHPLATLLALYLGLRFLGVWGIIIGPFLVILVKAVIKSLYLQSK